MRDTLKDIPKRPFFGTFKVLVETINSLDDKWFVEFWDVQYFFLGIEIFRSKREVVRQIKPNGKKV
ncbi:MAG TPA: hypothetical protein DG754_05165 [Bacteroidales bacterium]|jgi:hypothetical protein|nr:hypothetical protein [Bacteroidales bacterium]